MATERYIIKKIGEKYVPVPQEDTGICAMWALGGGALIGFGLLHRGIVGAAAAVVGAGLVQRGLTGRSILDDLLEGSAGQTMQDEPGPSYQHDFKNKATQAPVDPVDEAAMESFPASDPPSRNAAATVG